MKRIATVVVFLWCVAPVFGQPREAGVVAASRMLGDGTRSLLVHIREAGGPAIDEVRIRAAARRRGRSRPVRHPRRMEEPARRLGAAAFGKRCEAAHPTPHRARLFDRCKGSRIRFG